MNEQSTKLIEQLAEKLGTTSEYLFSILVKQAQVDSICSIILLVLLLICDYVAIRLHIKFSAPLPDDPINDNLYDKYELGIVMVMLGVILPIATLFSLSNASNIIAGFYNPEYWALNYILQSIQ